MKLLAFIKKDFLVAISYRFRIILRFANSLIFLMILYFIGKIFSGLISPHLERYGGNYFPFVLVGIAVSNFVTVGLGALAQEVRLAQLEGTLEALLSTPTSIYTVLVGNSLWTLLMALAGALLMLIGGMAFLQMKIPLVNGLISLLVLILTFIAFLIVGMLSASFIMIFKQGDPIKLIFGTSSYFLGGIFFPVEVMPKSFQVIASLLPITHAIKAIREILLVNVDFLSIVYLIRNLMIFILVLAPVSIIFFRFAVKRAKINGSLVQF